MSNPFLDPTPFGTMGDDSSQNGHSSAQDVSKGNPFQDDLLGVEFTSGSVLNQDNSLPDTLIDFQDEDSAAAAAGKSVEVEGVLLDIGGDATEQGHYSQVQQCGETFDLLGSNDPQFEDSFASIPPPMEFSDPFSSNTKPSTSSSAYATPVTNIDDLLGLDFMSSLDSVTEDGGDSELSKSSPRPDEECSNDELVPEVHGLSETTPSKSSPDVNEISAQLSVESPSAPCSDPPPIPTEPPPDLPKHPPPMTTTAVMQDTSSNSLDNHAAQDSNDFGVDAPSALEEPPQSLLPDIATDCAAVNVTSSFLSEHEQSSLSDDSVPSPALDSSPVLGDNDPPALPTHLPPLVPADQFASTSDSDGIYCEMNGVKEGSEQQEMEISSNTTTVFSPSQNPTDNVTQVSVTSAESERKDNNSNNNTIHVTDIAVTSVFPSVSEVSVTTPKTAPKEPHSTCNTAVNSGVAVVLVDNSSMPSATHIQFDNSTQETVVKSTLPPNAFMPTSVGITKVGKPSSTTAKEEEEEEEITPMAVHRDHQGNKLAAPSPPETLGRQWQKPRTLNEDAKRDLQAVLSRMTEVKKGSVLKRTPAEDGPAAQEDEIVPVKLSRREAEMAQGVLSSWINHAKDSPAPSRPPPALKSGFQKVAGTVINIQSGKEPLPNNCQFFTTIGVTNSGQKNQEREEEIVAMALHKDHLGNKHYAPSPPESLGRQSGRRQLDSAAKQDMADLLSGMTPRVKSRTSNQKQAVNGVAEEEIVATLLSREESRMAKEAVTKWLAAEKDSSSAPAPSPFQRLVHNVMDVADSASKAAVAQSVSQTDQADGQAEQSQSQDLNTNGTGAAKITEVNTNGPGPAEITEVVTSQSVQLESSAPPPPDIKPPEPPKQTSTQPSSHVKSPASSSTQDASQPLSEKRRTPPEQAGHKDAGRQDPVQQEATPTVINKTRSTTTSQPEETKLVSSQRSTPTTQPKETKLVSSQRSKDTAASAVKAPEQTSQKSKLAAPAKLSSLSHPSSLSSKPLPKLAPLTVTNRVAASALASSRLPTRVEYAKTRNDDSPFLVEVLKGIVGLGIKVKVNKEGHVEVTEVQRNSPVDKNGNVRVGDYLLSINTTELRGLTDGRVQQVLRLLPRGLIKLVVTTQPPQPLTPVQGNEVNGQASPRTGGAYSPYGVRLSARPFSPSADRESPTQLNPEVTTETTLTSTQFLTPSSSAKGGELPPTVSESLTSKVTQDVSSASLVTQRASQGSQLLSSASKGTTSVTVSSLPPPEKDNSSSTHTSSEKGDVNAEVLHAGEQPVSSAQQRAVSASSEPRSGSSAAGAQVKESSPSPSQSSSSSLSNEDSQVLQAETSPSDAGPSTQAVLPKAPPPDESLTVSVPGDSDDMEAHKLSRALSPRLPAASSQPPQPVTSPRPTPRQRVRTPQATAVSSAVEKKSPDGRGGGDGDGDSAQAPEKRTLTPSEIVAAASKRPSGRDTDLPSPPSSPRRTERSRPLQEPKDLSPSSTSTRSVTTTVRVGSPREEATPTDAPVVKRSPVPTPRPRSRLSVGTKLNQPEDDPFSRDVGRRSVQSESQAGEAERSPTRDPVVHAHMVNIVPQSEASSSADTSQSKVPPSVASKPRQPLLSDSSTKEAPCPTLVSARLRAYADPTVPTLEDQASNRKFVSSAARMFEQKASESAGSSYFSKPKKSSVSVSSVVKSLNNLDADASSGSAVVMRKKRTSAWATRDDLDSVSERPRSMHSYFTGSPMSVSSNLSHMKNLSVSSVTLPTRDAEEDSSSRLNSALSPRQARANTTSLKSVMASRDLGEGRRPHSPPSVGKSGESKRTSMLSEVTLRSRPSRHDPHSVTSQSNRKSWAAQTSDLPPYRSYTSSSPRSPRRTDRFGSSLSSPLSVSMSSLVSPRRGAAQSGSGDGAVRKLDGPRTTRRAVEAEDSLPKAFISLTLDRGSRASARREANQRSGAGSPDTPERTTTDRARYRTEAGNRYSQQSGGRTEVSADTEQRAAGETTGSRRSDRHSARTELNTNTDQRAAGETTVVRRGDRHSARTEVSAKSSDQPTADSTSPPSALPACGKSPDEFIVEERKKFSFTDNEIRAKEKEDALEKSTPVPAESQQQEATSDLSQTSGAAHEAAVGYIVAMGRRRNNPEVTTNRQAGVSKAGTDSQHPERPDRFPEQDTPARADRRTRRDTSQTQDGKPSADSAAHTEEQTDPGVDTVPPAAPEREVKQPEDKRDTEGEDEDAPPPPLPEAGPPPLPGAPPPSLPVSRGVDVTANMEDLEGMLPSPEKARPSVQTRGRREVQGKDSSPVNADEEAADTLKQGVSASSFGTSSQQPVTASPSKEEKSVSDTDQVSFPSSPPLPPTDLLGEERFPGKEDKDLGQENPPVSDTLSQDSGVQDEDMSEDGLRLSMDDSLTNTSAFDASITPDEAPVSVLSDSIEDHAESSVKVPSRPVAAARRTVMHASPSHTSPPTTPHSGSTAVSESQTTTVAPKVNASDPQASASPRCSSDQQGVETPRALGGVSTSGEPATAGSPSRTSRLSSETSTTVRTTVRNATEKVEMETETRAQKTDLSEDQNQQTQTLETEKRMDRLRSRQRKEKDPPPPQSPTEEEEDDDDDEEEDQEEPPSQQTDDSSPPSVQVTSPRKWCILDQSGSLFLQGNVNADVQVGRGMLRQVSSLQPAQLKDALQSANQDLDEAKLPQTLELRLVSARELSGKAVNVDIAQREDYFVQVTKVHSKDSSIQETDLLLSVDGHSLRHRRPAQVHTQLDNTGPKGMLLTARGLRLPPSVASALVAAAAVADEKGDDSKSTPPPPVSSPRTATASDSPMTAVKVGEGVYEVTMTKGPTGVGFCLEGGKGSAKGDLPILIKRIFKGGPAEKGGMLKVKDEVMAVNGVDYNGMGHYEAWNHLKAVEDGPLTLRIRRQQ